MSIYKMNTSQMIKFVELYKHCSCLWNFKLTEYRDRMARDDAMDYISVEMQINGFGRKQVAQKIKNIRTTYRQELQKIQKNAAYTPTLPWFESADSFLRCLFNAPRFLPDCEDGRVEWNNSAYNIDEETWMDAEYNHVSQETLPQVNLSCPDFEEKVHVKVERSDSPTSDASMETELIGGVKIESQPCPAKRIRLSNPISEVLEGSNNSRQTARKRSIGETEFDLWARSVAVQLNDMDVCRALSLQLEIQKLVTKERLEYETSKRMVKSPYLRHESV